jgi:hypothetical protein
MKTHVGQRVISNFPGLDLKLPAPFPTHQEWSFELLQVAK